MRIELPKPLPVTLNIPCYACEKRPATHLCRYKVGDLAVQVCLCARCMKIDTRRLLENTVGLQNLSSTTGLDDPVLPGLAKPQFLVE